MNIGQSRPLGGTGGAGRVSALRARRTASSNPARTVSDVTSIMGIPAADLTPKVHSALMVLVDEVDKLRRELSDSRARVGHLERLADQDALAPVANRRAFVREMSRLISFSQRYGAPSGVLYFDLNGMKAINDTYGHTAGDRALVQVANTLLENVRDTDVVGRLGGDEFGVLLAQADEATAKEKSATLAAAIVATPLIWEDHEIPLSVACGIYCFQPGEDVGTALARADQAMYADKQRSRRAA